MLIRSASKEWKRPVPVVGAVGCLDEVSLIAFMGPSQQVLLPSAAEMPQAGLDPTQAGRIMSFGMGLHNA